MAWVSGKHAKQKSNSNAVEHHLFEAYGRSVPTASSDGSSIPVKGEH
jgi:hypothetical protein